MEEWKNPFEYISGLVEKHMDAGLVKIVTPSEWRVPPALDDYARFRTRVQRIHLLRFGPLPLSFHVV